MSEVYEVFIAVSEPALRSSISPLPGIVSKPGESTTIPFAWLSRFPGPDSDAIVASGQTAEAAGVEKSIQRHQGRRGIVSNQVGRPLSAVSGLELAQRCPCVKLLDPVKGKIVRGHPSRDVDYETVRNQKGNCG